MGMQNPPSAYPKAVEEATAVLDRHFTALNAGDPVALAPTLHFPHYRLANGRLQVWEGVDTYLTDFRARAGNDWHHSVWDFHDPIAAGPDKVHFDVQFSRYRADGSLLGRYRAIWVVSYVDGRWAAQLRSSFAG